MNLSEEVVADCSWPSEVLEEAPWEIKEFVRRNLCLGEPPAALKKLRDVLGREKVGIEDFDRKLAIGGFNMGLSLVGKVLALRFRKNRRDGWSGLLEDDSMLLGRKMDRLRGFVLSLS